MKKRIALSILALGLLVAAVGCELYTGITLTWGVTGFSHDPLSGNTTVSYWVQNRGQYDLTGVNLEIGIDTSGNGTYTYTGVTPSFSIPQGQTLYGSIVIYTGATPYYNAAVLMVDMDSPSGSKTVYYKK